MPSEPLCPRCRQPLSAREAGLAGLGCRACAGVFVPAVAGFDFLSESGSPGESIRSTGESPGTAGESALACPTCGGGLRVVQLGATLLHRCGACGGRWLDREAATTLEAASPESAPAGSSGPGRWLLYSLTLPERVVRSSVGLAAGTAREAAAWLVPQAFQDSKTYGLVVHNSLRFLAEDIGGVARPADAAAGTSAEEFIARKAVGNFIDLAGLATLHVSPMWLLAIVSDVAYGSKACVRELADELKKQGLIDESSTIGGIDDVLAAVQNATGEAATLFDTPPLSADQLKQSLDNTRTALATADYRRLLPEAELKQYWQDMREIAAREQQSLIGVSGAVTMHTLGKVATVGRGTLTGVQVVGGLASRHVIGHYRDSLRTIRERGLYTTLRETAAPYIEAVGNNFAAGRGTWTEELLSGRALRKGASAIAGWFSRKTTDAGQGPAAG
ncbi:MAG TPA: zf-TFIIB domain-containing protein [Planctomycetaceae bacterium]|nr:zf-TFIIB domain-containing protein [Planctomycetaceae bacterium]